MGQQPLEVPHRRPDPGHYQRGPEVEHIRRNQHRGQQQPSKRGTLAGGQQGQQRHRQCGEEREGLPVHCGHRQQNAGELDGSDQAQIANDAHRRVLHHPLDQMEQHHAHYQEAQEVVHPAAGVKQHTEDEEVHPHQQGRVHQVPQLAQRGVHVLGAQVLGRHNHRELTAAPDVAQVLPHRGRGRQIDEVTGIVGFPALVRCAHGPLGPGGGGGRVIHEAHPTIVTVLSSRQPAQGDPGDPSR